MNAPNAHIRTWAIIAIGNLAILSGPGACGVTADNGYSLCATIKHDPSYWESTIEDSSRAFVGKIVNFEQTCGCKGSDERPIVELEVTEAFMGTAVGDHVNLEWVDAPDGCTPDVSVGEEWVLVTRDDVYGDACDPGFRLSDPESEDLLSLLRSQSAT